MRLIKSRNEDLAIYFISDHGYKDIAKGQFDERSFYEYFTPMTYFILSKSVTQTLKAKENLAHNKNYLISRYDMHLSLKHLSYIPFNYTDELYKTDKKKYKSSKIISVFKEKIKEARNCSDFEIKKEFCLCSGYINAENKFDQKVEEKLIGLANKYLIESKNSLCKIQDIIYNKKLYKFPLRISVDGKDTLYSLELYTKMGNEVVIKGNFCTEKRIKKTNNILKDKPYIIFKGLNGSYFLQIQKLVIPDGCLNDFCLC